MVIPDILANSGGVCISYLEWVQNNMGYYWSFDEVAGKMEANITRGLKDTHDISKKYKIDMLHVHYAIPHAYAAYMGKKMLEDEG